MRFQLFWYVKSYKLVGGPPRLPAKGTFLTDRGRVSRAMMKIPTSLYDYFRTAMRSTEPYLQLYGKNCLLGDSGSGDLGLHRV